MDLRAQKRRSILAIGSSTTIDTPSTSQKQEKLPDFRMKLVCVGDGGTGKTCMLIRYLHDQFNGAYVPTVFENYSKSLKQDGKRIELALWDTAGQEEYDRLRALSYPETDVCLVCFSVTDPTTLENAFDKWVPEIQTYCPGAPYILVACKADAQGQRELDYKTGLELAAERGAHAYIECSSRDGTNIEEPFIEAVRAVLKPQEKKIDKQLQPLKKQATRKISIPNYRSAHSRREQPPAQDSGANADEQPKANTSRCCVIL